MDMSIQTKYQTPPKNLNAKNKMIYTNVQNNSPQQPPKTKGWLISVLALFLLCFSALALGDDGKDELTYKAIEEDNASAQYKLGIRYLKGKKGESVDVDKAIEWLSLASEKGFAAASHRLAMLHFEYKHPTLSRQEALDLLEEAADKGHAKAKDDLASITLNPLPLKKAIVKKSPPVKKKVVMASTSKKSAPAATQKTDSKLISSLAQGGDANAQFTLAQLLLLGEGAPKDSKAAAIWFKKAANQGHPEAMFELGEMYAKDDEMKRYRFQAKRWYKKAADRGHTRARLRLTGCQDC